MSTLQLHFLGTMELHWDDHPLPKPPTLKSQSLFAFLVCHRDQPQPRERLRGLFWGERPEDKARNSLSTALWHIRRCLPDAGLLLSDSQTVQCDPQADLWLDVEAFAALAARPDAASLRAAVALYRGDFLDGFYDEWIVKERYRLETLFGETLARLMVSQEECQEHEAALTTALRLLDHDPLQEDAHRLAMRVFCRLGQRNAALEQYQRCQEALQQELDVVPMDETTALYQAIREGCLAVGRVIEPRPIQVSATAPPLPAGRSPLDVVAPNPLVGRTDELADLDEHWREATAGRGRLVLVGGAAGVGKTRLIQEFADQWRWRGARVLWGCCYEFERVLPYQPLVEALRAGIPHLQAYIPDLGDVWLAELSSLLPELRQIGPDWPEPTLATGETARQRLFEAIARFLVALSAPGPLLIVLEDLHWATESTLQLLHYLTRHLADHPVLLVGTFRSEMVRLAHSLLDLQHQLTQAGLAHTLHLAPLSVEAVESLVATLSGAGDAVRPLTRRLYQETEGNPFFLMETVKMLFDTGELRLEEAMWRGDFARLSTGGFPLPPGVGEAIQSRVRRLGAATQEALGRAAVLGREFDFDLLHAVWGRDEEATLEALDDLLRHRLIDEGAGALGRDYAFTHHKIQEAVYATLPRRRRQHLHARAGATLERLFPDHVEEQLGLLAHHWERAEEAEKATEYLLRAGDQARLAYAHQEAIDYYERALAFLKEAGDAGCERAARTLMKVGLTQHNAFNFRRARQAYEQGFALWQRAGELATAARSLLAPQALRVGMIYDPPTLDPALADHVVSTCVIDQLFSGLVEQSPEMEVIPAVARTWEVLEGGRKYVFHLRDDVRWSDGTPVTAEDFCYAWQRVLAPAAESPVAHLLCDIKGARAFHEGAAGPRDIGVRAIDEVTLVVELEEPTGYFPHLVAFNATYPVPRHVVEAYGSAWTEVENIVTNGPFRLESRQRGESMTLVRNPAYHGQFRGNAQRVELSLRLDRSALLELYEAGDLDAVVLWGLLPPEMDQVRQRRAGEYILIPSLLTWYVGFDASRPPFDDPRIRRAFALATDRETLANVVLRGYVAPATGGFVPPGMPGHSAGIGLSYDPEPARHLLAAAGYPGGCGLPPVDALLFQGREFLGEYLQTRWRKDLGVESTWETIELGLFWDRLIREPPHIYLSGWVADHPDPDSHLRTSPIRRQTRWQNGAYDRLVEQARRVTDQGKRIELYGQADRILVEEAAIIPLTYERLHLLVKPWVRRYPTSPLKYWFWKDVAIEPH